MDIKVISGGQTGVDRAALDAALGWDIPHGGQVPKGRIAEDGVIPDYYTGLTESCSAEYSVRTEDNVQMGDGTLIFFSDTITGGTSLTVKKCTEHKKPYLCIDSGAFSSDEAAEVVEAWVKKNNICILNVAGPRESECKELYSYTYATMVSLFTKIEHGDTESAKFVIENILGQFRHWDLIRWLIPSWFFLINAGVLQSLSAIKQSPRVFWPVWIFMAASTALCVYLEYKLIEYHRVVCSPDEASNNFIGSNSKARKILASTLPFSYEGKRRWMTATSAMIAMMKLYLVALLLFGIYCYYKWPFDPC